MSIRVVEKKYKFFDYVSEVDSIFRVTNTDNAIFVGDKEVAGVFITSEYTINDIFMRDDQYLEEVKRIVKEWVKYFGFKGDITITKSGFKPVSK